MCDYGLVQLVFSPPLRHRSVRVASVFVVGSRWLEQALSLLPLLPHGTAITAYDHEARNQAAWVGTVRAPRKVKVAS